MAVKYKLIQKVNPRDIELPRKIYASAIHDKHFKMSQLAKELAGRSTTASEGDTFSVLIGLRDLIREHLNRGDIINLDGIGSFYINAKSEGAEAPEKFNSANIKGGKLIFKPDTDMKHFIQQVKFEKEQEKKS